MNNVQIMNSPQVYKHTPYKNKPSDCGADSVTYIAGDLHTCATSLTSRPAKTNVIFSYYKFFLFIL